MFVCLIVIGFIMTGEHYSFGLFLL